MDNEIYIVIIEDELEVMEALLGDLEFIEPSFPLEAANNAEEAVSVMEQIEADGHKVGLLLCDHVLPGKNGIDLLIELQDHPTLKHSKKVLVTGQAGLEDTVQAINKAHLDYYIGKPWSKEELQEVVIEKLTDYVIEQKLNLLPFMSVLNATRLAEALRDNGLTDT